MPIPKILVIPGSLRTGSHNVRLAALAAREFALVGAEVTRISLLDYPLPLFDPETYDADGLPRNAVLLQRMMQAHQGIFITTPEYTASVTALLKNTIDWLSRARTRTEPSYAAFKDRVFAIGAASAGAGGGVRALMALRQILELGCGALVIPEQISVAGAASAFDDNDGLKDDGLAARLKALVQRHVDLARAIT